MSVKRNDLVGGISVMKREFGYLSMDGVTEIHAVEWIPEGDVKAVLQICHGMSEHIGRYDEFAEYLNERGICVFGHDHLGHGRSVQGDEFYGYFHAEKGNEYVIGDIHTLRGIMKEKYPDAPYFMLGHSMGSFLLRQYLTMYGEGLHGAVIMGTGHHGPLLLNFGQLLCKGFALVKGWKYRSRLIHNLSFGGFNKKFKDDKTGANWLSTNVENCVRYAEDPQCDFVFTVNGYYQMFEGMKVLTDRESVGKIPQDLPIFFVAGSDDPVGNFGKAVYKIYKKYKKAGIKDVQLKLYKGDRHEILNELDREQVYKDIYVWLSHRCPVC